MPHTPGPWHQMGPLGNEVRADDGRTIVYHGPGFNPEEVKANIAVMAASPDLLASLIETRDAAAALLRAVHDAGVPAIVMFHLDETYDGFGQRANAAIARATLPNPPESR